MCVMFKVQWGTIQGTKFTEYPTMVNKIIEQRYQVYKDDKNKKYAEWTDDRTKKKMRVYFDKMIETEAHKRDECKTVKRKIDGKKYY